MVPGSRLIDAPPDGLTVDQVAPLAKDYELAVLHTSTPSFANDAKFAAHLKEVNPKIMVGMVGAHVGVLPLQSMNAAPAVDWVAVGEFDYICADIAARKPLKDVGGVAYRDNGRVTFTPPRPTIENMDDLPFVVDVYKRDLKIENYFIGYLQHPYVSLYTGRGCRSKCTFCLWPQTLGGHRYRVRSADNVAAEMALAKKYFPQVREFFFDDDTFTDDLPRAEEIARRLGKLGLNWSCNAKANVPRKTLEIMKDNGLRLLLVGYESGDEQILINIKKGVRLDIAREFSRNAKELGIKIHGTFILGLPGESTATIQKTIKFACDIEPETIQVFSGRALSRHGTLPPGAGAGLAANSDRRTGGHARDPDLFDELPGAELDRHLQFGRGVLPEILFPPAKNVFAVWRNAAGSRSDEAAAARGRRVLQVPARAQGDGARNGSVGRGDCCVELGGLISWIPCFPI